MPALAIEKDVFTFEELSESAKETAREWMREGEANDFDTEFMMDDFKRAAEILGIEDIDIRYSGFCSQGDGASFTGRYSHAPQSPANIRAEYHESPDLYAIADGLDALQNGYKLLTGNRIDANITHSGNYCHEYTMSIDALTDSETGEELDYVEERDKLILELMRNFARWIYKSLEAEYDYRQSDECIDEMMDQYEFDEDGQVI